ncbi:ABC-2 type transport system ATP-binding protein [Natranaerovirga pectinivora]|uniref:ABC-2 type transport system ATP-binding protein n=1 Tax=Natranaerovirga pectinivora TaxID=682400 RepID=A0A4R3ML29_9FIRM|nr:ABC transporter ATP-binding protein [Natranaerovirga pectinivora]TCT14558.1 ABC-2 type transport system ATP-binding protein [Natranaerovirga pectinivora]
MIEIRNISKAFGKKQILNNINLRVEKGDLICLLGPSGAGKTTLIRLIIGAINGDEGEIYIRGNKMPNLEILKDIGFMPQNEALYNDISGLDNLRFFGGLMGLKGEGLHNSIKEILKLVNLEDDAAKIVDNYSGGMKKRLSLAIALLHDPDILILDEPTVGIDPVLRKSIWQEFNRLKENGKTIIVSTHVMDEVEKCEHAAIIYNGILIAYGAVKDLAARTQSGSIEELFFTANGGV